MLDPETLNKLTTALSGDIELYNAVLGTVQEKEEMITKHTAQLEEVNTKLTQSEERNNKYLGQISNLLSKIPIGNTETPLSMEDKMEEIKNRTWAK